MSEPIPDFSKATFNYDEFHPLDHALWECRGYPGGLRRHWEYALEFLWVPRLRRATLCRMGRHRMVTWQRRNADSFEACQDCETKGES